MAWTTPRTWATNDSIGASTLNTHLRDNLNFLYGAPRCRVYNSTTISHTTSGSWQALTFNSERFDNDTVHSTSSNTGRITATNAGAYMVGGSITFAANATGRRGIGVRLNGATFLGSHTGDGDAGLATDLSIATLYALAASDYVELVAYQSSGGALNVSQGTAFSPEFWAAWQGN